MLSVPTIVLIIFIFIIIVIKFNRNTIVSLIKSLSDLRRMTWSGCGCLNWNKINDVVVPNIDCFALPSPIPQWHPASRTVFSLQIDTEFMEVLAFRQIHKSFFSKPYLMFVCMLKPKSSVIEKQDSEIEAAHWMPVAEYAKQPFIKKHKSFDYISKICMAKKDKYGGFSALSTATATSAKKIYLFSSYQEE